MTLALTHPPAGVTFLGARLQLDLERIDTPFVFLGVPHGQLYDTSVAPPCAGAPDAVRAASQAYADVIDHYDFDLGGPLFPAGGLHLVDAGDVRADLADPEGTAQRATAALRAAVAAGAVPLVMGGDHAIPPLVVRALDPQQPLHIVHIDAHLDFRDEVGGVREGYSSPIRRLSELPWVGDIIQVGLRGPGSAREREVLEARAAALKIITAPEVHERGVDPILALLRPGERYYVTVDVDGLDLSCAPGAARLIQGVARTCRLAGIDVCEIVPDLDVRGFTALTVTRLLMIALGTSARRP